MLPLASSPALLLLLPNMASATLEAARIVSEEGMMEPSGAAVALLAGTCATPVIGLVSRES